MKLARIAACLALMILLAALPALAGGGGFITGEILDLNGGFFMD
jgi:hypothetical protein